MSSVPDVLEPPNVRDPSVLLPPMAKMPTSIVVLPVPVMGPVVTVVGEFMTSVALLVILPVPMVPALTPSPSCNVPP